MSDMQERADQLENPDLEMSLRDAAEIAAVTKTYIEESKRIAGFAFKSWDELLSYAEETHSILHKKSAPTSNEHLE